MPKLSCAMIITTFLCCSLWFTVHAVGAAQPPADTGTIRGRVTDLAGQPLNAVKVITYVYDQAGEWQESGVGFTDQIGSYLLTGLAAGRYRIGFFTLPAHRFAYTLYKPQYYPGVAHLEDAGEITVAQGEMLSNINAQLVPKAKIYGKVTDLAGEPLSNIVIRIYIGPDSQGQWRIPTGYIGNTPLFHTSNGVGLFELPGLDEGRYRIGFSRDPFALDPAVGAIEYYDNAAHFAAATIITVVSNTLTISITADLAVPTGNVRGRVTNVSGEPLAGIRVVAANSWRYVHTDASGYYTLTGVPVGDTQVSFLDVTTPRQNRQWAEEYYNDSNNPGSAVTLSVQQGQTIDGIDATLAPLGRIQGRVIDRTGAPITGILVTFFASYGYPLESVMTDVHGQFNYPLDRGDYKIGYQDTVEPARFLPLYYPAVAILDHAALLTVTNGISLTADAQLVALRELTEHRYFPLIMAGNEIAFPSDRASDKNCSLIEAGANCPGD